MDARIEMDLSTRPRDGISQDGCKVRVAKSVFSIRSLVDLGDNNAEKIDGCIEDQQMINDGKCFLII